MVATDQRIARKHQWEEPVQGQRPNARHRVTPVHDCVTTIAFCWQEVLSSDTFEEEPHHLPVNLVVRPFDKKTIGAEASFFQTLDDISREHACQWKITWGTNELLCSSPKDMDLIRLARIEEPLIEVLDCARISNQRSDDDVTKSVYHCQLQRHVIFLISMTDEFEIGKEDGGRAGPQYAP